MLRHVSSECVSQSVQANTTDGRQKTRVFETVIHTTIPNPVGYAAFKEAVGLFIKWYALSTSFTIDKPDDFTLRVMCKITEEFSASHTSKSEGGAD